jgi:hypothetical protein
MEEPLQPFYFVLPLAAYLPLLGLRCAAYGKLRDDLVLHAGDLALEIFAHLCCGARDGSLRFSTTCAEFVNLLVQLTTLKLLTPSEVVEFIAMLGHQSHPLFLCTDAICVELLLLEELASLC